MSEHRDLFDFAAKLGCLEGYMYKRENAEPQYLPNWVNNISNMYMKLPDPIKLEIKEEYLRILRNILDHTQRIVGPEHDVVQRLNDMIGEGR